MEITYKTDSHSNLVMTIKVHTATDYKKVDDKLYTHSEYDAEWDNKLSKWRDKEYFERDYIERYEGRESVIFEFMFSNGRAKRKEFIQELNEYFDEHARSFDTINYVESKSIKNI